MRGQRQKNYQVLTRLLEHLEIKANEILIFKFAVWIKIQRTILRFHLVDLLK